MTWLKAGVENTVEVEFENTIDITGFSAELSLGDLTKTIGSISSGSSAFTFSSSDIESIGEGRCYGVLKVKDSGGNLYLEMRPEFTISEAEEGTPNPWRQTMIVVIVGDMSHGGGGGGGSIKGLCDPMDYSLPGSSLHVILQARILEWVPIFFSR